MIRRIQQGLSAEGITVSIARLCAWFGVPRRTVYYKPVKAAPRIDPRFAEPIKAMIEEEPSFGYRTVAWLLGFNKNTVQRIFRLKGWQVRKRAVGMRPRIQAVPSVATAPNERWSTDIARIWTGRDGWASLALVIDCHTRELLGWHLSRSGKASTASVALEHAPLFRAQAGRGAMCLQVSRINHHRFLLAVFGSQPGHHLSKDAFVAPSLPTIVERLVRARLFRRIPPA